MLQWLIRFTEFVEFAEFPFHWWNLLQTYLHFTDIKRLILQTFSKTGRYLFNEFSIFGLISSKGATKQILRKGAYASLAPSNNTFILTNKGTHLCFNYQIVDWQQIYLLPTANEFHRGGGIGKSHASRHRSHGRVPPSPPEIKPPPPLLPSLPLRTSDLGTYPPLLTSGGGLKTRMVGKRAIRILLESNEISIIFGWLGWPQDDSDIHRFLTFHTADGKIPT